MTQPSRRHRPLLAVPIAALLLTGSAGGASADQAAAFSPAQRAEIVSIVRDALKTDPSILGDAIVALRAQAERKEQTDTEQSIQANRGPLNGQPGDAILGNPTGTVSLVEFYDPRCPYCRKVLPDLDSLLASDRQLRLVEKLIPILGPNSVLDARAIQAASLQGRYLPMQQALMTDNAAPGLDRIRSVAGRMGLNVPKLLADMKSPVVSDVLERNVALAHTLHLTGTPTFIIGHQVIPGAADLTDLQQAVAAARKPG